MLAAERRKKIIELIEKNEAVRVTELSILFSVTEETIRRDLEKLESENKIIRKHGGAIKVEHDGIEEHFKKREILNVNEKKEIADLSTSLVEEGDKIFIDASTTAWYFSNRLPNIPLVVITNSVQVVNELAHKDKIEVISTGGRYTSRSHSFVGPLAEKSIMSYHVNKAFISSSGVHILNGVSDTSESQAILKNLMIQRSEQTILMMDSSKESLQSFSHITEIENIDTIVTTTAISSKFKIQLEELGINVLIT